MDPHVKVLDAAVHDAAVAAGVAATAATEHPIHQVRRTYGVTSPSLVTSCMTFVLKIHRNIYGQKQAGKVWNKYLVGKLVQELGYTDKLLYVLYTDDSSLLAGPD